ncbi:hypothetical protein ACFHWD_02555 [Clostridium sp. MT-14]|jgi:flagellar biosynthesis chaperone FliJ|uniref:Uncharacterized protein n=1 Tax=Clostridium aromativorans TaxID=2836848 RepID=A0ABS8N7X4_9CLOT|nr:MULTISPECIES: hypothetical protein [Clostridium]KAA8674321.1 hypothetical protein F3O63_08555 [Clostridium sp. HV4-5-A1G]MCC9294843.1 hypothetical protein [Clostridium aromativorans]CAB1250578.1 conserved hypothetical protein [Clostridiaceae bacterium BL-3]
MEKLKAILTEIAVAVIILLVICMASLVDIKSRESPQTSRMLEDMNITLQQYKKSIDNLGNIVQKENIELQKLKNDMNSAGLKNTYKWNETVVAYNSKFTEYNSHVSEYNKKMDDYNKRYQEYESIKKKNENIIEWIKAVIGVN